jgi:hypothetical protein
MNRNELEQWMKNTLGEQPFTPDEAGWAKLQAALPQKPVAKENNKRTFFIAPLWFKTAAAAALLFAAATSYYFLKDDKTTHPIAASTKLAETPVIQQSLQSDGTQKVQEEIIPLQQPVADAHHAQVASSTSLIIPAADTKKIVQEPQKTISAERPSIVNTTDQKPIQDITIPKKETASYIADYTPEKKERATAPLNIGVAAQLGRASVGNMQYQLGLVAHKDISDKFYAEATLAVAATDVRYNQERSFSGLSFDGISNAITYEEKVNTQYGRNVVSMGISPGIGYRITRQLAVAAGASVYRNLNESLSLKNDGSLAESAFSSEAINATKPINQWDLGLTGNASFNVSHKLSVSAQYRYGLSAYMEANNQQIRNSGMNIGLKYLFGK